MEKIFKLSIETNGWVERDTIIGGLKAIDMARIHDPSFMPNEEFRIQHKDYERLSLTEQEVRSNKALAKVFANSFTATVRIKLTSSVDEKQLHPLDVLDNTTELVHHDDGSATLYVVPNLYNLWASIGYPNGPNVEHIL